MTVNLDGHVIAVFHTPEGIFAVDNHAPTVRAQAQTYQIALRLNRGEHVFDEE